jgi:hypothetical protein
MGIASEKKVEGGGTVLAENSGIDTVNAKQIFSESQS